MKEVITYQPPYSPLLHQMSESALQGDLFFDIPHDYMLFR